MAIQWKEREYFRDAPPAVSDSLGQYKTQIIFNAFSGNSRFGDECNGKLHWIVINVNAKGHVTRKEIAPTPLKGESIPADISLSKIGSALKSPSRQ